MGDKARILLLLITALMAAASTASDAQAAKFTAASYPATLKGEPIAGGGTQFTVAGGRTISCLTTTFSGTLSAASSTATVTPSYSSCQASILGATLPATVTFSNCDFLFHVNSGGGDFAEGTTDLVCPVGGDATLHIYKEGAGLHSEGNELCRYTVQPQSFLAFVNYTVTTGPLNDLDFDLSLNSISYTRTLGTLAICGAASGTMSYTTEMTMKAFNAGGFQVSAAID